MRASRKRSLLWRRSLVSIKVLVVLPCVTVTKFLAERIIDEVRKEEIEISLAPAR